MKKPRISIIAAVAKDRAIGKNNELLWHIPGDLKHFKEITEGHPIIMGQKTFESIGRPLPNRLSIVLNPNESAKNDGCETCPSLEKAIEKAKEINAEEIFIIGGGSVFAQTLGMADRLYLTIVDGEYEADTYFPDFSEFTDVISEEAGKSNGYTYKFLVLEK
jgi:dihydrofolate reductase